MDAHVFRVPLTATNKTSWKVPVGHFLANLKRLDQTFQNKIQCNSKAIIKDMDLIDFCPAENVYIVYLSKWEIISSGYKTRLKTVFEKYKDPHCKIIVVMINDNTTKNYLCDIQSFSINDLNMMQIIPFSNEFHVLDYLIGLSKSKFTSVQQSLQKPSKDSAAEDQIRLVSLIPTVDRHKAKFLLETFGHVRGLSEQNVDTLTIVAGEESAKNIWNFFHA